MSNISAEVINQIEGLADELQMIAIENEIAVIDVWSVGGSARFIMSEYYNQDKMHHQISRYKTDDGRWK